MKLSIRRSVALALLLGLLATGCKAGKVKITGKVTDKGAPIVLGKTGRVQVTLVPAEASSKVTTYPGVAQPDGSFEIPNVPPGKYKVVIDARPTPQAPDKLNNAFSTQNTKIIRDVDGKKPLDLDVSKPSG